MAHSLDDFDSQMRVNFLGHVATAQAFLPRLIQAASRGGRAGRPALCFVNSFGGRIPLPNMTAYSAAKFALQGFADSLRLEAEPCGVHVATVHPGVIRSEFRQRAQFRGQRGEVARTNMDSMLDGDSPASGVATQSVDEVADAVFSAVQAQQKEVVVGSAFKALVSAHTFAKAIGVV